MNKLAISGAMVGLTVAAFFVGRGSVEVAGPGSREQTPSAAIRSSADSVPGKARENAQQTADDATRALPIDSASSRRPLAIDELRARITAAQSVESPLRRLNALEAAFRELAAVSPVDAFQQAGSLATALQRRAARLAVIEAIALTDPAEALRLAATVEDSYDGHGIFRHALELMALTQPEEALAMLPELQPNKRGSEQNTVYRVWGQIDPQAAMTHAMARKFNPVSGNNYPNDVFAVWLRDDAGAALAWYEAQLENGIPRKILRLGATLARRLPEDALRIALASPSTQLRESILSTAIGEVAATNPERAVELAERFSGLMSSHALADITGKWQESDLGSALDWASTLEPQKRRRAVQFVVNRWMNSDPDAAIGYIEQHEDPVVRRLTRNSVISSLTERDPAKAFEWLVSDPQATPESDTVQALAMIWSMHSPDDAVAAFESYQDEGWGQLGLALSISALAGRDLNRAQSALANLTNTQARRRAVDGIARGWSSNDPRAAVEWSNTLPPDMRDPALLGAVQGMAQDPQGQYDIAQTISDPELRYDAIRQAIYAAARLNPDLARQWLSSNDLSPEFRRSVERYTGLGSD